MSSSESSQDQSRSLPESEAGLGDHSRHAVLLFDGVCNLCNRWVNFVIDHDPERYFLLGALQADEAQPYLDAFGADPEELDSVVLIENGQLYTRSTAILRVARRLERPWPVFYALVAIPRPVRDRLYDWVATNRYQWFGTRDQCRVPTPELRSRFLERPG